MSAEAAPSVEAGVRIEKAPAPPVTIEPLFDRLLVLQKEEKKKSAGGIEIAEQYREKPTEGLVIARGSGCQAINVGDTVLFHLFAGVKVPEDYGKNLVMLAEAEVMGRLHRG